MNERRFRLVANAVRGPLWTAALLAAAAISAFADEPSQTADCLQCHKSVSAQRYTHGPIGVQMCSICHVNEKKGAKGRHSFSLSMPQPELCLSCHDALREKAESSAFPHLAIAAAGCTGCHDPHGSGQKFLLKGKSMDETCSACHEPKTRGAVVHPPAKASCAACHDPHGGQRERLLKVSAPELCLGCHQKAKPEFAGKHVHGPVNAGCPTCHDPHSAPKKLLLKADAAKDLCLSCHEDIVSKLKSVTHPHPAVEKFGCTACHTPHTSDQPRLLRAPLQQLCVSCHKDKNAELKAQFLHGPVVRGQCQDCHDPHGSTNESILKVSFPKSFYNPYQEGLYGLCFNCHDKGIAKEPTTRKLTDFRNGEKNLHFVHVNADKGRSCKACHAVHGGNQEKHIREGVPFGSWTLPIKFTKTGTGGSCIVGCHNPRSYDRVKAVVPQ